MLEKPDFSDENIVAGLRDDYGLLVVQITFLPPGADTNTAVYRAVAADGTPYFVKLRRGNFDELSVKLPKFLSDQNIRHIIPPTTTKAGQLYAPLGDFKLILYPFVEGRDGYVVKLSERHWRELGATLKRLHTTVMPPALKRHIQQETYTPQWRATVRTFLERIESETYADPIASELAAFLQARRDELLALVARTERLALMLQAQPPQLVLCHSDIHAGNILIEVNESLYIVDWDNPILAPKERDLMFIGGGQGFVGRTAREEEALFYQGYGQAQIDSIALSYYRYERIIQDIALFCEQIFLTTDGGADRAPALRYLQSNFLPNGTLAIAYQSDQTLRSMND
jgi:spectinomycin phosphotransferase